MVVGVGQTDRGKRDAAGLRDAWRERRFAARDFPRPAEPQAIALVGGIVQRHSEPTGCLGLTTLAGHWHTIGDDHQTGHFRRLSKMVAIASASFGSQPRRWEWICVGN